MPEKSRSKTKVAKDRGRSAYSVILDQSITLQSGRKRETLGPQEALQVKIYQEAMEGKVGAARTVWSWIKERQAKRKPEQRKALNIKFLTENQTPVRADQALLLLDIACEDAEQRSRGEDCLRLKAWAVQLALDRGPDYPTSPADQRELREHTADPEEVWWPEND